MFVSQTSVSSLQVHAVRFGPGQELLGSLQAFVEGRRLRAPFIITCVGSVTKATLRLANATATNTNEVLCVPQTCPACLTPELMCESCSTRLKLESCRFGLKL